MAGGSRTPGAAAKVRRRGGNSQTLANLSASQNFVAARCAARALAAPRGGSRREMRSQAVRGGIARGATMAESAARGRGAAVVAKAPARAARRAGCFVMRAPCGDVRAQTLHTPPTVVAWCAYNARELGSSCWWYLLCTGASFFEAQTCRLDFGRRAVVWAAPAAPGSFVWGRVCPWGVLAWHSAGFSGMRGHLRLGADPCCKLRGAPSDASVSVRL